MSNRGLYQMGLVFAVLTALAWVLFVVGLMMPAPGQEVGEVAAYLADAESTGSLFYLWGGILGSLCVIPVYLAICVGYVGETGSVLLAPVGIALAGVVLLALGFLVDVGSAVYYFSPAVAQADAQTAEAMVLAAKMAQDSIEMAWGMGSFLAYGGPMVWMAALLLRSSRVPVWLNGVGIVAGLAGFVWIVSWLPLPPVGPIPLLVNIVAGMVWLIGVTWVLARTGDGAAAGIKVATH